MKLWPWSLLLIVIIFGAFTGAACGSTSEDVIPVTRLVAEYWNDEEQAADNYGGRRIVITGEVAKVDHMQGRFVIFTAGDSNEEIPSSLWCYSSTPTDAGSISRLVQYDVVRLSGEPIGFEDEECLILRIENCKVLNIVPSNNFVPG